MSAFIGVIGLLAFFAGIIMILINLVKKQPKKKSAGLIIIGLVLFIVGVSFPSDSKSDSSEKDTKTSVSSNAKDSKKETTEKSKAVSESKPKTSSQAPTATPVTFEQMVADYMANGAAADDKYEGKLLEFQGAVTKVTSGYFGKSDVEIDAGNYTDNPYMNTKAVVKVPDDIAKTLVAGQTYTFVAKGSSAMILDSYVSHINFTDGKVK